MILLHNGRQAFCCSNRQDVTKINHDRWSWRLGARCFERVTAKNRLNTSMKSEIAVEFAIKLLTLGFKILAVNKPNSILQVVSIVQFFMFVLTVFAFKYVKNWQNLSVVWHKCFSNHFARENKML